jgi:DNA polymerase-3 subunit delta'
MTSLSAEGAQVPLHPDVVLVARDLYPKEVLGRRTDEKVDISVDQVRRVILEKINLTPHEAPQRVVIVRDCEQMSVGAANALLKTLEEPPSHTRFVLLTSKPGELLPTIRSRTQLVRFSPLTDDVVEHVLLVRGVDLERARKVAPLAAGSVSAALALADPRESEARAQAVEALRAAASGPLAQTLEATSEYANTGEARVALTEHLAALAAEEAGEVRRLVLSGGDARDVARALARRDAAVALTESLERNANVPLALEAAWLQVRRK